MANVPAAGASESLFRSLLESAPDAMVTFDGPRLISLKDSKIREPFGSSPEEPLGKPLERSVAEWRLFSRAFQGNGHEHDPLRISGVDACTFRKRWA